MPDHQPNPTPDKRPQGPDPLFALATDDLDRLLAEAESLVSAVAHEVGVHDIPLPTYPEAPPAASDVSSPEPAVTAPRPASSLPTDAAVTAAPAPTLPISTPISSGGAQSHSPSPDAAPAAGQAPKTPDELATGQVDASAALDDAGVVDAELAEVAMRAATLESDGADPAAAVDDDLRGMPPLRRKVIRVYRLVRRHAISSPLWLLAAILWIFDLPFRWLSPAVKNKVGYAGMATAIMAALAWILVLLSHRG